MSGVGVAVGEGVGVGEFVGVGERVWVGDGAVVGEGDCVVPVCVGLSEGLGTCVGLDTGIVFELGRELAIRNAVVPATSPMEINTARVIMGYLFFQLLLMVMQISPLYYYLRLNM
jgi:hypothetical protein